MAVPEGALNKNLEYVGMDIRQVTQKFANKAAIELLKHMALNMKKEHFSDPRSFSYNKGIIHCLFRISNPDVPAIMEVWKKVPDKTKKYWKIILESDFDENGPIVGRLDEKTLNREKARFVW